MKRKTSASLLALFLSACSSSGTPLTAMPQEVDIPRFMGPWYVIANIPTIFESGAHNALEIYTWNEEEKRIDIDFRFNKDALDGPIKKLPQKGWIYNETTKSEWRVQPLWPFKLAYLILDVAPDYSDTIIGVPSRKYVWIMARTPTISAKRMKELTEKVQSFGYDPAKLQTIPHSPAKKAP
jgi:apolipoprotein D and lipocalin family protein